MALILSIESATPVLSVALHMSGNLLSSMENHLPKSHSNVLPDMVEKLLEKEKISTQELAAVAIGTGPGLQMSLRITGSFVKGLCYGRSIPLIGISTLTTLVQEKLNSVSTRGVYCPLIDLGKGYAYGYIMDKSGRVLTKTEKYVVNVQSFEKWLSKTPVYFTGSGATNYADLLKQHFNSHIIKHIYPKASAMGMLAYQKFMAKDFISNLNSFLTIKNHVQQ